MSARIARLLSRAATTRNITEVVDRIRKSRNGTSRSVSILKSPRYGGAGTKKLPYRIDVLRGQWLRAGLDGSAPRSSLVALGAVDRALVGSLDPGVAGSPGPPSSGRHAGHVRERRPRSRFVAPPDRKEVSTTHRYRMLARRSRIRRRPSPNCVSLDLPECRRHRRVLGEPARATRRRSRHPANGSMWFVSESTSTSLSKSP